MIYKIIAYIRFSAVTLSMLVIVLAVLLIYPFSKSFVRQQVRVIWTRCLIASIGAKLKIKGYKPNSDELRNSMIVSNHISWLDTVVMLRLYFVQYIGKIEMQNWPILNKVIASGGTIFINRKIKRNILAVNQEVARLLQNGATIGLFPEGKTTSGVEVLPFKAPILEAAMMAKSKILPVIISYKKQDNTRAKEVSFGETGWFTTVMNILLIKNLKINVTILAQLDSTHFKNRDELSDHLYQLIKNIYMEEFSPIVKNIDL